MEHLLARLEVDSSAVSRLIVKLILSSYLPLHKPTETQVERCIVLLQSNEAAARTFYRHAPTHLDVESTGNLFILM